MDVLPRIAHQLFRLFHEMSSAQRIISVVVSCFVLAGFGWLLTRNPTSALQPVSYGKVFSSEEIAAAERSLSEAGLTKFRREGQRLLAPASELPRYNAALLESDALPSDLGSQMLKQYDKLGPFSTDRQRQQMKEAHLLRELRRMIKDVPDIEDAHVTIAASERRAGWNQKSRGTANISLKPRPGCELSSTLVNSLRHVVANMVPDLKPADVTVFDVTRGQAFTGETTNDTANAQYLLRANEFSRQYERQIQRALAHIPGVNITVHVDFEPMNIVERRNPPFPPNNEESSRPNRREFDQFAEAHQTGFRGSIALPADRSQSNSDRAQGAFVPRAVQVSVSVPRNYLNDIASHRIVKGRPPGQALDPTSLEEDEIAKIERTVRRLIPADAPAEAVSVMFVDQLTSQSPVSTSMPGIDELLVQARTWLGIAGVGIILIGLTIWILKSCSSSPDIALTVTCNPALADQTSNAQTKGTENSPAVHVPIDNLSLLRDEVRMMTESDPAASVVILGRWLSESQPQLSSKMG